MVVGEVAAHVRRLVVRVSSRMAGTHGADDKCLRVGVLFSHVHSQRRASEAEGATKWTSERFDAGFRGGDRLSHIEDLTVKSRENALHRMSQGMPIGDTVGIEARAAQIIVVAAEALVPGPAKTALSANIAADA